MQSRDDDDGDDTDDDDAEAGDDRPFRQLLSHAEIIARNPDASDAALILLGTLSQAEESTSQR